MLLQCILLFLVLSSSIESRQSTELIEGGGYTAKICLNLSDEFISIKNTKYSPLINCSKTNDTCSDSNFYFCELPCKFSEKVLIINFTRMDITYKKPIFKLLSPTTHYVHGQNMNISFTCGNKCVLMIKEITIKFFANVSCSNKTMVDKSINCKLNTSQMPVNKLSMINVSISYGSKCNQLQSLGYIMIVNPHNKTWLYIICSSIIVIILFIPFFFIFIVVNRKRIREKVFYKSQLINQDIIFSKAQKKAFQEYQTAVQSFSNLGKLSPLHLHSFHDYMSQMFNVELQSKRVEDMSNRIDELKKILLDKESLIHWIDKVEINCLIREKCTVASFLTIFLIYNPDYGLKVMKALLTNLIKKMKMNSEERLLFSRSGTITEKIIGYWLTLCMYENIKTGEIGRRYFNLYRSIKCKSEMGLMDMFTNKAKFALNFDNLLLGDLDCETLNVIVKVEIEFKMKNISKPPLRINLVDLNLEVLSLDSISQVKQKIIDKAIFIYLESKDLNLIDTEIEFCIAPIDIGIFKLHFVQKDIKIHLEDFDNTSIITVFEKESVIVNTMKHYNIKNETKFELTSNFQSDTSLFIADNQPLLLNNRIPVHLQIPNDITGDNSDKGTEKLLFHPIVQHTNQDAYFLLLLATKKSLLPIIDGFIQCLMNWKPNNYSNFAKVKLNEEYVEFSNNLNPTLNMSSETVDAERRYLAPIYYLFSMLDDIASSLSINDKEIIQTWKSNSFIRQFWVNLIKHPNFLFSVDVTKSIHGSLTTIANTLMESCSATSLSSPLDVSSPFMKQLFADDIANKYSLWWQSFIDATTPVNENEMVKILNDIIEKNNLKNLENNVVASIQMITRTVFIEVRPRTMEDTIWSFDSIH